MTLKTWGYKEGTALPKPRHVKKKAISFHDELIAQGYVKKLEGYKSPVDGKIYTKAVLQHRAYRAAAKKEKASNEK